MSRFVVPYLLTAALWGAYAVACGVSYGKPLDVVGWPKSERVAAGQPVVIGYTVTRLHVCEVTRYVTIIDGGGRRHEFPAEYRPAVARAGETESFFVERTVPADAQPGPARYRAVLVYECPLQIGPVRVLNLVHQVTPNTLVLPGVEFEILPGAGHP